MRYFVYWLINGISNNALPSASNVTPDDALRFTNVFSYNLLKFSFVSFEPLANGSFHRLQVVQLTELNHFA